MILEIHNDVSSSMPQCSKQANQILNAIVRKIAL